MRSWPAGSASGRAAKRCSATPPQRRRPPARRAWTPPCAGATARDLIAAQAFVERKELDRQAAALDLDRQDAEVDARRTALALAARDREVIERLERRKRSEHIAECARLDQIELDEIALAVHRRGAVAA